MWKCGKSLKTQRTGEYMEKKYRDLIAWIFLIVGLMFLVLLLLSILKVI